MPVRKVRFGLYGCNLYRTKNLVDALVRACPGEAEIVAGFDVNPTMVQACQERYGLRPYHERAAFLAAPFDVALVSLPPYLHAEAYAACAAAGKDVYLEKPVCVDDAGRASLLATQAAYPRVRCYVGMSYRHVTVFRHVAELARRRDAGQLIGIHHHWFAPGETIPPEQRTNWRHKLEQSGGQLVHHCCHYFDWLEWVGGPFASVSASAYTHPSASLQHEEQEVTSAFTYRSGALAVFNLSQHTHQNVQFGSLHFENLAIRYEWNQLSYVKLYTSRPRAADQTWEWTVSDQLGDGGELDRNISQMREFVTAWRSGAPMPIGLADGIRTYDVVKAVRQSCREGRRIAL